MTFALLAILTVALIACGFLLRRKTDETNQPDPALDDLDAKRRRALDDYANET